MADYPSALSIAIARRYEQLSGETIAGGVGNAVLRRTRAGQHQRSAGAWSWVLVQWRGERAGREIVGSQWPARQVARGRFELYVAPWGDVEFIPVPVTAA